MVVNNPSQGYVNPTKPKKIRVIRVLKHKSNTSIIFSSFMHALILFTILCSIFVYFISKKEADTFKWELNNELDRSIPDALRENDKSGNLKRVLQNMPLDKIQKVYERPTESVQVYNNWVKTLMIVCIVAGTIGIVLSSLFLYFTCNRKIPFWHILIENILIFIAVGFFELYFFLNIGVKYVPVPPSFIITRLYTNLKNW